MELQERIRALWAAVAKQEEKALADFFHPDAVIFWHNTNEQFTLAEYLRANCEYPGDWNGQVERIDAAGEYAVSVARVWSGEASFHAVSFYVFRQGKICRMDEYWGDDGPPPQWRRELGVGRPIERKGEHAFGTENPF